VRVPSVVLLASLAIGCGGGSDGLVEDGGMRDGAAMDAAGEPCVTGSCPDGRVCVRGRCVEPLDDADEDGIPDDADCGPDDPAVGATDTRSCACPDGASGAETCADGVWGDCECVACMSGETETETEACTGCMERSRMRSCGSDGSWEPWGAWTECMEPTCTEGEEEMDTRACGMCGTQTRTRVCGTCGWDPWGDWGTCSGEGPCAAGTTDMDSRACGECMSGTQTRSRTCSSSCEWSAWSAWSTCTGDGPGDCSPGELERDDMGDCGTCGVLLRRRACSDACTWSAWSSPVCVECFDECDGSCVRPADSGLRACSVGGSDGYQECVCDPLMGGWGACDPCEASVTMCATPTP